MKLISKNYRKLNAQLHSSPRGFGGSGYRWVEHIRIIMDMRKISSLLDYGCGQSTLWSAFKKKYPLYAKDIEYQEYDPCIPKKDVMPKGLFDLVACTDVLEHVEPAYLDNVIAHIFSLTGKVVFFNIALRTADKMLPDGRNAHLIIRPSAWWEKQLRNHLGSDSTISYMRNKGVKDINLLVEI